MYSAIIGLILGIWIGISLSRMNWLEGLPAWYGDSVAEWDARGGGPVAPPESLIEREFNTLSKSSFR